MKYTNNPSIRFYLDYELDCINCFVRLRKYDPAGLEYRIKDKGLDSKVIKRVVELNEGEAFDEWQIYYQSIVESRKDEIEFRCARYIELWIHIEQGFISLVNKRFDGLPWNYSEYLILVSAFYSQASWGKSNKIGISSLRKPESSYQLIGYELILTHVFEAVDQIYKNRPVDDWQIWAIAEITAATIINYDVEVVEAFWPHLKERVDAEVEYFNMSSYPQLYPIHKDVFQVWKERSSFRDYLERSIKVIKNVPVEVLKGNT